MIYSSRRIDHHIPSLIVFWKGDEISDRALAIHDSAEAIKAKRDASVRRSAILECAHQEAELLFGLTFGKAQQLEVLFLEFAIVNSDRYTYYLGHIYD